jgi:hypothetical protein
VTVAEQLSGYAEGCLFWTNVNGDGFGADASVSSQGLCTREERGIGTYRELMKVASAGSMFGAVSLGEMEKV